MKTKRIASLVLVASLTVIAGYAQTAAEQMQKGIYTQETAGDLDGAISIYRQIVNSGSSPRDIAAQAQYRLAQSLLQKGDLSNAAQEFEKLARNYADYGKLVSSMASMARANTTFNPGRGGRGGTIGPVDFADFTQEQQLKADEAKKLAIMQARLSVLQANGAAPGGVGGGRGGGVVSWVASTSFDSANPVTVKGTVSKVEWVNPVSTVSVDPMDGTGKRYTFFMTSPNQLVKQGATRASLKLGDEVTITGLLATGGQTLPDGMIAGSATTVTSADGHKVFDRAAVQQ